MNVWAPASSQALVGCTARAPRYTGHVNKPRLFSTRNYVIDLETLALGSDALVTSAALAQFGGPNFGPPVLVKTWTLDVVAQQCDGRRLDAETCLWWMLQPEAARLSVAGEEARKAAVHPRAFLVDLFDILAPRLHQNSVDLDFTLWAKPQHFDLAILEHLANMYTVPRRDIVLHRRKMHNVRTALAMVNALRPTDMEDLDEAKPSGDEHSAAADVLRTAEVLTRALQEMNDLRVGELVRTGMRRAGEPVPF